jgi:glycosyltransferase involved in cell wall biosynthesis
MSELPTLSCMVLYKNELPHLERVVPKLVQAFDEVVLVTNREPSSDGSDEFLARHKLSPLRMDWVDDFSVARQCGLDHCHGDYTMWMDCDDDITTSLSSFAEAKRAVKGFLAESRKQFYLHRIYHPDLRDYWVRENWFARGSGVKVKYPTHEIYLCSGSSGEFRPGLLDRINAPLRPDYPGKLWRYFDMLHRYLRDVDPNDARCKYYLAREFRGPACAHVALFLDFWKTATRDSSFHCFSDECGCALTLHEMRSAVDKQTLYDVTEQLILRHPFEFLGHVVYCMVRCEHEPSVENGTRFYNLLRQRERYRTDRTPYSHGWYYDRALNCCGYHLYRTAVRTGVRAMAEWAVEILREASRPESSEDVLRLAPNNLKIAEDWLLGFGPAAPAAPFEPIAG